MYGSIPYAIVLPIKGTQWKTTGGSCGFLYKACPRTLSTTDRHRKAITVRKMRNLVEDEETMSSIGERKAESRPIATRIC